MALSLNNLAQLYVNQGRYAQAEPLHKRSLAIREKALGPDHPDVALSLNNLARLYHHQGLYAQAEPLFRRALAIREKALGPEHPDVATSLNNLALLYYNQGLYAQAEPLYKQALKIDEKALGPEHPDIAASLNNLALLHVNQGLYAQAEPLYQRSLAIGEKALGPEHPNVAISYNSLAFLYHKQGLYAKAEPLYQRSLAIREKALGPEHPDVATSLNNLAALYYKQGLYAKAEPLYQRSLVIMEKALGPEHPDVALSLNNLAQLYVNQGRYAQAEPLHKRWLAIREKVLGPEHPNVAISYNSLAFLYHKQGLYAKAEPLNKRTLAIREKALGPDHPDVAASLNNLAELYRKQGLYVQAEPLHKRALAIREKALEPDHPDVAQSLNNLALLYNIQGRYAQAEPLYKRALAIREKALGPDHPDVATSLNNLALLYHKQGLHVQAEPLHERALAIREKALEPDHPDVAQSLNNLALLYNIQGRYAQAEPLYKRALAILEKALGADHPDVASSINNLAQLYNIQGQYAQAELLHERALAIREKALGPEHPDVALSLNNLALLYHKQGLHVQAEPLYQRALSIGEKALGADHPDVATSLNNLAYLHDEQGQFSSAYKLALRATSIQENRRFNSTVQSQDKQSVGRANANNLQLLTSLAWKLSNESPSRLLELVEQAFRAAQLSSSSSAAAALNQMAVRFGSGVSEVASVVRKRQDTVLRWQALDKKLIEALGEPTEKLNNGLISSLRRNIADTNTQLTELDDRLALEFPRYAELSNPKPLSVDDVQKLLKSDEALLTYQVASDQTFIWAITNDDIRWQRSTLGSGELRDKVASLRADLDVGAGATFETFDIGLAHELYQELIGPVSDLVSDKQNLLIVADGALTSLPFHVLVGEEPIQSSPGRDTDYGNVAWLLKRHATTTLPSVSSLRALRRGSSKEPAPKPMIGFGDPVFARDESKEPELLVISLRNYASYFRGDVGDLDALSKGLPRLPETADELRAVAYAVGAGNNAIKLRQVASERTVKGARLDDYGVVYFATHALVAGETRSFGSKAEPALALSLPQEATDEDDGLLMASEVAQLKLNADWVVLSACNTAAGNEPGAEALSGLARAFFYAGARSLLVSHWPVESNAAVILTSNTFKRMAAQPRLGKSQALRQSMLALMNDNSKPHNQHPAIWAPFVVVGEGKK